MQVRRGRIHGFLGPNGSGKTTTIRMLCGLLTPGQRQGHLPRLRHSHPADAQIKRRTGYMTQRFSLYADLTIRENLEFIGRIYGLADPPRGRAKPSSGSAWPAAPDQLAGELSGGWKQRLALGACIMPRPELLLLDEPTAGVDPKARRDFWDEIHQLAHEGLTVLVSTHYMDEAERCHEIAYIAYGHLLAQGTLAEIVAQSHLSTYVVSGADLGGLAETLKQTPGVDMVAPFGARLHVAGRDAAALDRIASRFRDAGNFLGA